MRNAAFFFVCAALWLTHAGPAKSDAIQAPRTTTASLSSISEVAIVSLEILPKEAQEQARLGLLR